VDIQNVRQKRPAGASALREALPSAYYSGASKHFFLRFFPEGKKWRKGEGEDVFKKKKKVMRNWKIEK
jgi:hypothetical protein